MEQPLTSGPRLKLWAICALVFVTMLAGCNVQSMMGAFIPKDEAAIGQHYIDGVRTKNFGPLENDFNPNFKTPATNSILTKMAQIFPVGEPKHITVVGSHTVNTPAWSTYNFTYEYEFPHKWILGHIYFKKTGRKIEVQRIDVIPLRDSLEHLNAFTFAGKGPRHYLFLSAAILLVVFTIGTAVVCFRTPIPKRKWLWLIFVLFGFVQFVLNWTTGAVAFNPLSVLLFGAGFFQQFYGPVTIQIAIPVGAIIFWMRREKWMSAAAHPIGA